MTEYEIVVRCETVLGWTHPQGVRPWKARQAALAQLKHAMAKKHVSVEEVAFALELSRREKNPVDSPAALVWRVERANEVAVETRKPADLSVQIQEAIDFEMDQQMHGWEQWVSRLSRCAAQMRREVFEEWASQRLVEVA